ncbi:competence protein ComFC [Psychrobacillus psychrotolerans]|uniref:Competence protein ComFC n=1 Tax=Psychrobacillus psychrotolerans TaxID=126156 RepID=A0A1I5ZA62_9BACI|nr:ComF family protein [Psychrobacillus psychrotolerans]SFQ53370.1 competence protein ComFC [Psychrobacillus psychrotolerans]
MTCLICGTLYQPSATWSRLFIYELDSSTCKRCFAKFEISKSTIDFTDFLGTPYEGAVDSVFCLYSYNEPMKEYLHQYKFLQDVALAKVFSGKLQQAFQRKEGIVVPIPMHPEKLKLRTFSQVDKLLNAAQVPFQQLLTKTTSDSQGKKTKKERLETTNLFEVISTIEAANYILFDDIYTTGATIHHAAKILKDAGAKRVDAITLIKG